MVAVNRKSQGRIRIQGQQLQTENGHVIVPIAVGLPMRGGYNRATRELIIDLPHLEIPGTDNAGILRLRFSPEGTHSLVKLVHSIAQKNRDLIGEQPKIRLH